MRSNFFVESGDPEIKYCLKDEISVSDAPFDIGALITIASSLESDGGMPGANEEERIVNSMVAVCLLVGDGDILKYRPFRAHVKRLLDFLKTQILSLNDSEKRKSAESLLAILTSGSHLKEDWRGFLPQILAGQKIDLEKFWTLLKLETQEALPG